MQETSLDGRNTQRNKMLTKQMTWQERMENSTLMYTQRGIIKNEESFDDYEEQVDRKKKNMTRNVKHVPHSTPPQNGQFQMPY